MGQYLSPLVVLALSRLTGSLSGAIRTYAVACAISALIALLCLRGSSGNAALGQATPSAH
jgi:hypothetical protein